MAPVCSFGLGAEAAEWLASHGGAALGGLRRHSDALASAMPWASSAGSSGKRRFFGDPTAFHDKKAAVAEADKDDAAAEDGKKKFGCFPASASVYAKGRGPVRVADLQAGDNLLCGDAATGSLFFSPYLGYLHVEAEEQAEYLAVRTTSSPSAALRVSPEHLVFASRGAAGRRAPAGTAVPARELRAGDWLSRMSCDGDLYQVQVAEVSEVVERGVYAPLTRSGTVVVDNVLCSCYVDAFPQTMPGWLRRVATSHEASHGALLPLRTACRLGLGLGALEPHAREGIHPYCCALMAVPMAAEAAVA